MRPSGLIVHSVASDGLGLMSKSYSSRPSVILALTVSAVVAVVVPDISVFGSLVIRKVSVPPFFGACAEVLPPLRASAERPANVARRVGRNFAVMSRTPIGVRASLASACLHCSKMCARGRESCWRASVWTYILRTGALHDITFGQPRPCRHQRARRYGPCRRRLSAPGLHPHRARLPFAGIDESPGDVRHRLSRVDRRTEERNVRSSRHPELCVWPQWAGVRLRGFGGDLRRTAEGRRAV